MSINRHYTHNAVLRALWFLRWRRQSLQEPPIHRTSRTRANRVIPCHFDGSKIAVCDIKGSQRRDFKYAQLLMFVAHNQHVGRVVRIAEVNDNEDTLLRSYCVHPTIYELWLVYFQRQF